MVVLTIMRTVICPLFILITWYFSLGLSSFTDGELAAKVDLERMKTARWLNHDEVALQVGFFNYTRNPYPNNLRGYDVQIDNTMNCYLVFLDKNKNTYDLITAPQNPLPDHEFGSFWTHTLPCGVCSNLQDLAVYLEKRDLTNPVRKCAKMLRPALKRQCLRNLGFSERCLWIWYWNTLYTRKGCLNVCLRHIKTPNNQPIGNHNPCKPIEGPLPAAQDETEETSYVPPEFSAETMPSLNTEVARDSTKKKSFFSKIPRGSEFASSFSIGKSKSFMQLSRRKVKGCRNSINNQPACDDIQWRNGEHRLNPCLQCDECKAGPMFKKVSGRVRRNSGIRSAIERPGVPVIDHHYFTEDLSYAKGDL